MPKKSVPPIVNPQIETSSDEEDDAPEEISVSSSRQQNQSQEKDIREAEKLRKQEEKDKRRRKNDLFRLQKQKKLEDLSKRKLPQDVLDAVSASSTKKSKKGDAKADSAEGNDEDENDASGDDDDDGDEEDVNDSGEDRLSDSGLENDDEGGTEDFISLSKPGGISVLTQRAVAEKKLSSTERALQFRQSRLYNQRDLPRQSYKKRQGELQKKAALRMT